MLKSVLGYFGRVRQRAKSYREGRRVTVYTLSHDASGLKINWLTVENETSQRDVGWSEVGSIYLFKRDLLVVDQICMALNMRNGEAVEINEEMKGWDELVKELPQYLPGCQTMGEWFQKVAFPAFADNVTLIYERVSDEHVANSSRN